MRELEIWEFIDDDEWDFPTAPVPPDNEEDDDSDDSDFEEESHIQESLVRYLTKLVEIFLR